VERRPFRDSTKVASFHKGATVSRNVMSACVLFVLLLTAPSANAQSIVGQLGTLLTEQRSAPVFGPDVQAAVATATTVAGLFSTELSNLPLASSSGGFVYRLDPGLGVVSRVSDALAPSRPTRHASPARRRTSASTRSSWSSITAASQCSRVTASPIDSS
jgi:hypothetical protein